MKYNAKIAPSLLSADFIRLADEMERFKASGAEILHLDVMDGHFVPNLTFGWQLVADLRPTLPGVCFDAHLMIDNPARWAEKFCAAGADMVTVHAEASGAMKSVGIIAKNGVTAGVSIKPGTPAEAVFPYLGKVGLILIMTVEPGFGGQKMIPECLDKIAVIKREAQRRGIEGILYSVDGGINAKNCRMAAQAGADVMVAGSAAFGAPDMGDALREMTAALDQ